MTAQSPETRSTPALSVAVARDDPRDPGATALLRASHALMESLFPPEENFHLDIDALCAPDIRFFTARAAGSVLGTGALAIRDGYGEVKSMFVDEAARGRGVAEAILRRIEDEARTLALPCLRLETGISLHAALRLYRRHGFEHCRAFGDYPDSASSIFMEKPLAP
ncbi:MAG: GNAT family N-acetyltransferase [Rhodobacteraceae bacterium CG17_big_fil_post_rev_8_21_14_2_50_63_15]|nr:MAG: GNAT family N-acetyltransferase [Rhodobacteraceae bacterium CG17_big_fil_post_rev_8_21_14_2_50_63_15]